MVYTSWEISIQYQLEYCVYLLFNLKCKRQDEVKYRVIEIKKDI